MKVALVVVTIVVMRVETFRPYVTCVGCDTFIQCFLTCPVSDYPGVNRSGRTSEIRISSIMT